MSNEFREWPCKDGLTKSWDRMVPGPFMLENPKTVPLPTGGSPYFYELIQNDLRPLISSNWIKKQCHQARNPEWPWKLSSREPSLPGRSWYLTLVFQGDTVHLLPALWMVRQAYPIAELHVTVAAHVVSFMDCVPWADQVWGYMRFPRYANFQGKRSDDPYGCAGKNLMSSSI